MERLSAHHLVDCSENIALMEVDGHEASRHQTGIQMNGEGPYVTMLHGALAGLTAFGRSDET